MTMALRSPPREMKEMKRALPVPDLMLPTWRVAEQSLPPSLLGCRILERIGEGAGSSVYAVEEIATGQLYALKHVLIRTPRELRLLEQLQAEFEIGRSVAHRGLRKSLALTIKRSWLRRPTEAVLTMELVDGLPLDSLPGRNMAAWALVFMRTAEALQSLHGMGYVHCDMKPGNVLVGHQGLVKVIDLGQACPIGTVKERVQGTPDFMAPEQVNRLPVTHRTDVFNLGAMMYYLLSGRKLPTLLKVKCGGANSFLLESRISPPSEFNPLVPKDLSDLVMALVRTNPDKRVADMCQVIARLESIRDALGHSSGPARLH